jgi:hypothetical protein
VAVRIVGWLVIVLIPIAILGSGELLLRALGKYRTYSERNGGEYVSMYQREDRWFLHRPPNSSFTISRPEFRFESNNNSHGFRDVEWVIAKSPSEFRVVVLGDSFIEGFGAPPTETMPAQLQNVLSVGMRDRTVQVMNGGISGSDPVHNFNALTRVFLAFKPDLVIQAINETDILDVMIRGGIDRYDANGHRDANPPALEPLFRASHLARAILLGPFHYDHFLMSRAATSRARPVALKALCEVVSQEAELARTSGFRLLVVAQPASDLKGAVENPLKPIRGCVAAETDSRFVSRDGIDSRVR